MEDDSAAEHSTEQIETRREKQISLSYARSATEHRANEAVTTQHMQGSAAAQCAPVSEHTSQASSVSELVQWLGPQPPTQAMRTPAFGARYTRRSLSPNRSSAPEHGYQSP